MIHVCSLARLHRTVEETGARHVVTLLRDVASGAAPRSASPQTTISSSAWTTSPSRSTAMSRPARSMSRKLIAFARGWDRATPLVVHCYAGISRSTAGAFVAACALNPGRDGACASRRSCAALRTPPRPTAASCRSPTTCSAATAAWSTPIERDRARRDGLRGGSRSGSSWNSAAIAARSPIGR